MSKRADQLAALRHVADTAKLLLGGSVDIEALRQAVTLWEAFQPLPFRRRQLALSADGGRGGCVDFDLSLPRTSINGQILKTSQNPRVSANSNAKSVSANGRPTWLSDFAAAWVARFGKGSTPPWGQLARALKPVVEAHGEDGALVLWKNYLQRAEVRYVSAARFAATAGAWTVPDPDEWRTDPTAAKPGETTDEYISRQNRGGR